MADFRTPWTNFTAGEWTEQLIGRYDIKKYFNSARKLWNFMAKPFGGVSKRPGTVFVWEQKDMTRGAKCVPFKFSKTQTYMIVFEGGRIESEVEVGGYLRFFSGDGIVVESSDPVVEYQIESPYTEADLPELRYAQLHDVMYIVHPNHPVRKLIRSDHTSWSFEVAELRYGPFGEPNKETDLFIEFDTRVGTVNLTARRDVFSDAIVGEVMRIQDGVVRIDAVTDGTHASGTIIEEIGDGKHDGSYSEETLESAWTVTSGTMATNEAQNVEATGAFEIYKNIDVYYEREHLFVFTPSGDIDSSTPIKITLTVDDYDTIDGSVLVGGDHIREIFSGEFTATDSDIFFVIDTGEYTLGQLDFNSTENAWPVDPFKMQMTFTIEYAGTGTVEISDMTFRTKGPSHPSATMDWAFCAFSDNRGYPSTVGFYESRMLLGNTAHIPNGFWMSKSDSQHENFNAYDAELATSGMFLKLEADELEELQWFRPKKDLWIGTDSGIWRITSSDTSATIAPENIKAVPETSFGGDFVDSLAIENVVMYIARGAKKVREIAYNLEEDNWKSVEASLFGEHLFAQNRIRSWAWQQHPYGMLWVVRDDGLLVGMTYMREQNVIAWWRCPMPEGTEVESVASIPTESGDDRIWMTVKRVVNGNVVRYVEYIDSENYDQVDWHYVDCGLKYNGTPISTVSGLDHLIGETVKIFADGATMQDQVVDENGEVELYGDGGLTEASVIHVGLPISSTMQTQNLEQTQENGSIQGLDVRIAKVVAKLFRTGYGLQVSDDGDDPWEQVDVRFADANMDEPPPPYTGDADVYIQTDYDPESSVFLRHEEATACNIIGLIAEWEGGE